MVVPASQLKNGSARAGSSMVPTTSAIQSLTRWRAVSMSPTSVTQRGLRSMNSSRATVRSARTPSLSITRMRDSLMALFLAHAFQDRHDLLDVGQLADEVVGAGALGVL